jgi:hypothetical protein
MARRVAIVRVAPIATGRRSDHRVYSGGDASAPSRSEKICFGSSRSFDFGRG